MGINTSRGAQRPQIRNEQEIEFYTSLVDPHLGPVKIYQSKNYHLCFILKTQKSLLYSNGYNSYVLHKFYLYLDSIQRGKLVAAPSAARKSAHIGNTIIIILTITLKEEGSNKISSMLCLLILKSGMLLISFGIYYEINSETLVINPEGKLRAFWCHLKSHNNHIKFFQYFDSNYKICRFPYSPQELAYMHEQQRTTKLDFDKCNSFRLGILLLQCLSLTDPLSNCYNPSMTAVNHTSIRNLIATRVVPHYSNQLVNLLYFLLRQDPKRRPTLAEVYQRYHDKFDDNFQLRVCGIKNNGIMQNNNDFLMQVGHQKNMSEHSDQKTVKIRHSNRR